MGQDRDEWRVLANAVIKEFGSVHVRLVVDKVVLGQDFPRALRFSPVNFIPPMLHSLAKCKNWTSLSSSTSPGLHNKP
jgi:hypothetical protein